MTDPDRAARVERLGHVNIRTPAFAETIAFYESALGLRSGPAASAYLRRQNVWLYDAGGTPIIHVNGLEPGETAPPPGCASRLDHFAVECSGLRDFIARLRREEVRFDRQQIAARGLTQLVIVDPNGLKIELTFDDATEAATSDA